MRAGISALGVLVASLGMAFTARAAVAQPTNPAGVGNYSYIQLQRTQWGNSSYFGDSAKGNGVKASYQFGQNAYVFGSYGRLDFDKGGYLYHSGVGIGYAQTEGKVSAYLQGGYYRDIVGSSRSYYWEFAYGLRGAVNSWFGLEGQLYTELHPEFGSVPWGVKFGANIALGPLSLRVLANHNRDVNGVTAALRFAF